MISELSEIISKQLVSGRKVVLFLSGGSAIDTYFPLFNKLITGKGLPGNLSGLTLAIVDERFGSDKEKLPDGEFNSAKIRAQVAEIDESQKSGLKVVFYNETKSAQENLIDYAKFVSGVFADNKVFKAAVLGIGQDYHIAGIKPLDQLRNAMGQPMSEQEYTKMFYGDDLLALYPGPDFPLRLTLTFTALRQLNFAGVYLVGKPDVVEKLQELGKQKVDDPRVYEEMLPELPMAVLSLMANVSVYTTV